MDTMTDSGVGPLEIFAFVCLGLGVVCIIGGFAYMIHWGMKNRKRTVQKGSFQNKKTKNKYSGGAHLPGRDLGKDEDDSLKNVDVEAFEPSPGKEENTHDDDGDRNVPAAAALIQTDEKKDKKKKKETAKERREREKKEKEEKKERERRAKEEKKEKERIAKEEKKEKQRMKKEGKDKNKVKDKVQNAVVVAGMIGDVGDKDDKDSRSDIAESQTLTQVTTVSEQDSGQGGSPTAEHRMDDGYMEPRAASPDLSYKADSFKHDESMEDGYTSGVNEVHEPEIQPEHAMLLYDDHEEGAERRESVEHVGNAVGGYGNDAFEMNEAQQADDVYEPEDKADHETTAFVADDMVPTYGESRRYSGDSATHMEANEIMEVGHERHDSGSTSRDVEAVSPLPDDEELSPLPDDGEISPLPDDGEVSPLPDDGEVSPLPEDEVVTPLPDDEDTGPRVMEDDISQTQVFSYDSNNHEDDPPSERSDKSFATGSVDDIPSPALAPPPPPPLPPAQGPPSAFSSISRNGKVGMNDSYEIPLRQDAVNMLHNKLDKQRLSIFENAGNTEPKSPSVFKMQAGNGPSDDTRDNILKEFMVKLKKRNGSSPSLPKNDVTPLGGEMQDTSYSESNPDYSQRSDIGGSQVSAGQSDLGIELEASPRPPTPPPAMDSPNADMF